MLLQGIYNLHRQMTDLDIYCNYSNCREALRSLAWVTSCSHAFCIQHGSQEFSNKYDYVCPACKTALNKKYDVVKVDLNPSPEFRSMVLAGFRPEIIVDIAQRAITFWIYQIYMENMYQAKQLEQSVEENVRMREEYETVFNKSKLKEANLKQKINSLENQIHYLTRQVEELKESLHNRHREYSEIMTKYSSLKRSQLCISRDSHRNPLNPCNKSVTETAQLCTETKPPDFVFEPSFLGGQNTSFMGFKKHKFSIQAFSGK